MTSLRPLLSLRMGAFILLTALLIWVEMLVTHTAVFGRYPVTLSFGVLFDLIFVPTGVFYWLVARPLGLAAGRLIIIALLMLRVALFMLPEVSTFSNQVGPLLLALSEGVAMLVAGLRIRTIVRTYRNLRPTTDAETALLASLSAVFGEKIAAIIIGEGLILYYVLVGWRLQPDSPARAKILTTHRQSGQIALLIGLGLIGIIEGVSVHLLLTRWSPAVAFWVTVLSGYGMLFLLADAIATLKRPSYLAENQLYIRLGVRWRAHVPLSLVADISCIHEKPAKQMNYLNGSFLTTPNVLLTFTEPVWFVGPYGLRRHISRFAFFVDDQAELVQLLLKADAEQTRL